MNSSKAYYHSPIGWLKICANQERITSIVFVPTADATSLLTANPIHQRAIAQLREYFEGGRTTFDFPMRAIGTPFQQSVWEAIAAIPYGQLQTYKQIAEKIGKPKASRAVGMACNKNPLLIAIPCHRVVGSNGKLVGYAHGVDMKRWLLDRESGSSR